MSHSSPIPAFGLYGEVGAAPDNVHVESFEARAKLHGWRILPHRHGRVSQLFIVSTGRIEAHVDGSNWMLGDGSFLYIPEHCVHEFTFLPETAGEVISFPLALVRSGGPQGVEMRTSLARPFAGGAPDRLTTLALALRDAATGSSRFARQQAHGLALTVLALLAEIAEHAPGRSRPERLIALDDLIDDRIAEGWSASDYARALSISTGHLSRLCREATGRGAAAYIEARVMDEACRMLAFTDLPVSEVGYRLGYADPSHFSRRFRALRRQTPTAFRAQFAA